MERFPAGSYPTPVDHPVRMLSKNFLAIHQLDINLWTEFLCVMYRENLPSRIVSSKRAICVHLERSMAMTMRRRSGRCKASAARRS